MFRNLIHRPFLFIYLPYLILLTSGLGVFVGLNYQRFYEIVRNNEYLQVGLAGKSLVRDFDSILPDIEILNNDQYIQQFALQFDTRLRHATEARISSFMVQKRVYSTVRIINNSGRERLRVEYHDGQARTVEPELLADVSRQAYFLKAHQHKMGELYLSPLSLAAVDHLRQSQLIHYAMPIFDAEGNRRGLLQLDYDASRMLSHFDEMLAGSFGHVSLISSDGHFIRLPSEAALPESAKLPFPGFQQMHKEEWAQISAQQEGQLRTNNGLFTFASVYPVKLIGGYQETEAADQRIGHHHIDPKSYTWKIVSDVPQQVLGAEIYRQIFGVSGIMWLLLAIAGVYVARHLAMGYTERKRLLNELQLHSQIYLNSTDGVLITDANQNILSANDAMLSITGYSLEQLIGQKPSILSSGRHEPEFYQNMWRTLRQTGNWEGEIHNRHRDGTIYVEWIRISAIRDENNVIHYYVALVSDITQKKIDEEQLREHAHHDPLTGTYNRLAFDELLQHELLMAKRKQQKLALLYIDLDKFKPINDQHGHQAGDHVLQTVARRIGTRIRETDTLSRLGGDEFVVILDDVNSLKDVERLARSILEIIDKPIQYAQSVLQISASLGIALFPDDGNDPQSLLDFADRQMYRHKTSKDDKNSRQA